MAFYAFGAFPVRRDKGDAESVRTAVHILRRAEQLEFFPRGAVCLIGRHLSQGGRRLGGCKGKGAYFACLYSFQGRICPLKRVVVRFGEILPLPALSLSMTRFKTYGGGGALGGKK